MMEEDRLRIFCALIQGVAANPNVGRIHFSKLMGMTEEALAIYRPYVPQLKVYGRTPDGASIGFGDAPLSSTVVVQLDEKGLPVTGIAGQLRIALEELVSNDIDCLAYPEKDVCGEHEQDDAEAPFWSECGLYGRVGKEAARTLLARRRHAMDLLKRDPDEE